MVVDRGTPTTANGQLILVDPVTGAQTVISSGGILVDSTGVTLDANGVLLVADNNSGILGGATGSIISVDPVIGA